MTPEEKIADLKANFDYVLEGKDLEIKELKDRLAEEVELHLHAEEYIKSLEKGNAQARKIILKLYNAGRDVLMCRAEEKAYDNLDNAINDRSIEQFLKEIEK